MIFAQDNSLIGDVDCDGDITSQDASLILQFVTNVIDELPCQENMTGLTPEQLQEIINMMDEQININYSGGAGSNYPIMVSSISSEAMNWGDAVVYCADLEEDGYSDWFLPNLNQLAYAVSGGCELPDERTQNSLWTTSKSHTYYDEIIILNESGTSGLSSVSGDNDWLSCRCVRLGEGETSEGSSNSSGSGSSIEGTSEQPITMIGPMYKASEFNEFSHSNWQAGDEDAGNYNGVRWFDAIRFCLELEYGGFTDWSLPSFNQLINYYELFGAIEVPNFNSPEVNDFWTKTMSVEDYRIIGFALSGAGYELNGFDGNGENMINYEYSMVSISQLYATSFYKCFCVR